MDQGKYSLHKSNNPIGAILIVCNEDGREIPCDSNHPDYCKFMQWHSETDGSPKIGFRYPTNSKFYCTQTENELLQLLKLSHHTLLVEPSDDAHAFALVMRQYPSHGKECFHQLVKAGAAGELGDDDTVTAHGLNLFVSTSLARELQVDLRYDMNDIRRLSTWPVEKTFVYVDVSEFSKFTPVHQTLVINQLTTLANWQLRFQNKTIDAQLCIGDGYIFVFHETVNAVTFAARLASAIERDVADESELQFHFRIGVHVGPVYHFWDSGRNEWNYVGEGINGGSRVLEAIGHEADDIVFVSHDVRRKLLREHQIDDAIVPAMQNRGRRPDKHGNMWRLYELHHTAIK